MWLISLLNVWYVARLGRYLATYLRIRVVKIFEEIKMDSIYVAVELNIRNRNAIYILYEAFPI